MSVRKVVSWCCNRCGASGGTIDDASTIPTGWMSLIVLVGAPQLRSEMARDRHLHLCALCSATWLAELNPTFDDENTEAIRALAKRAERTPNGLG